eukprot:gene15383-biopygen13489
MDERKGGDMRVLNNAADSVHRYYEGNSSQRHTGEYMLEHYLKSKAKLTLKGNVSAFERDYTSNVASIIGNQLSYYDEASAYLPLGRWLDVVAGVNLVGDQYRTLSPDTALLSRYDNFTVGAFAQGNIRLGEQTTIEAGMRMDKHQRYGIFLLPRLSVFHRFNEHWATRGGFGMGYKTPNPLVQQIIEYSVLDLLPLNSTVTPETSYGYNAEVNYKHEFSEHVSLFVNEALFLTQVQNPVVFYRNITGKHVILVLNGENLLDYRMSRVESLYTGMV